MGGGANQGDLFNEANILKLLSSRTLILKALLTPFDSTESKTTSFLDYYIQFSKLKKGNSKKQNNFDFPVGTDPNTFSREQNIIVNSVYNELVRNKLRFGSLDRLSSFLQATCFSENEKFSKRFVEQLLKTVSAFYIATKTKRLQENVTMLEEQLKVYEGKARENVYSTADLEDKDLNASKSITKAPLILQNINTRFSTETYSQIYANYQASKLALLKSTPLIQVIDAPVYPLRVIEVKKLNNIIIGGLIGIAIIIVILIAIKFLKEELAKG